MIFIVITSYEHGHQTEYNVINKKWVYSDTKEVISHKRPCMKCGCKSTKEGYDSCLGFIPNASSACCGHGVENPYVVLNNGEHFRFENIEELKKYFNL